MKNPWMELRQSIAKEIGAKAEEIEEPDKFGDFAYPCFELSKNLKKSPKDVALEMAGKIKVKYIKKVEAIGPFLNFYVDWQEFSDVLLKSIDEKYGSSNESETVMMDIFQANPFKSFHIGHVRNAVIGEAIRRILEKTGRKTIAINYNGDVGIHVARWLLYYNKFCKGELPKENFTKWSGEIYAKSAQMSKDDPVFEDEAQELNRKIDRRDPSIVEEWKMLRDLCYKDYEKIRNELDVKVDQVIPESECEEPGKKIVMKLFEEGKLEKSEGAIGIDLEEYGLGFFILLKTDSTAIYATKDIGLLQIKKKHDFDKMIFIVGSEQDHYFKQLLKTFDLLGLYPLEKSRHVSYGLVTLKEGKMASRLGNVITYEELRDMMIERVLEEIDSKNPDMENKKEAAKNIALGAIKFQMLDIENNKMIKFDWEQALDINGRSGPYLQYSAVRALNILNKDSFSKYDASLLKEETELKLIKKMARFPNIVKNASDNYSPNIMATFLFELAQEFNTFYQSLQVLKAEDDLKNARLKLVETFMVVFKSGLNMLGIPILEKM
ncbi:MAG: arginine--tRNA ligase [Candidatus Aenigmatarchaeota archaeon]